MAKRSRAKGSRIQTFQFMHMDRNLCIFCARHHSSMGRYECKLVARRWLRYRAFEFQTDIGPSRSLWTQLVFANAQRRQLHRRGYTAHRRHSMSTTRARQLAHANGKSKHSLNTRPIIILFYLYERKQVFQIYRAIGETGNRSIFIWHTIGGYLK